MSTITVAACENHPQREAIGVCVQCRTRVCSECSTKVEGINYCVRCLDGLARAGGRNAARAKSASPRSSYVVATGALLLLAACVFFWLQVFLPGG